MDDTSNSTQKRSAKMITRRCFICLVGLSTIGLSSYLISRGKKRNLVSLSTFGDLFIKLSTYTKSTVENTSSLPLYRTNPVAGIPHEWIDQQGIDVLRYANFILDLDLKNISPYDVLLPHFRERNGTSNSIPPRHLWKNIAPTLAVVDRLSSHFNAKIEPFISIYRSPAYNRVIRGRSRSQMLTNRAVKVQFRNIEPSRVARVARQLRKSGLFKGGVGNYKNYTYLDTRGQNADW